MKIIPINISDNDTTASANSTQNNENTTAAEQNAQANSNY
jgi:hypothetical protein